MPEAGVLGLLFVVGVVAGTINVIAGGGSLLSLPALIFFGLPPSVANGTNRLGIIVQSLTATAAFKRQGIYDGTRFAPLLLPCCAGAIAGAMLSVDIAEDVLKLVIGVAMLVMLAVMLAKPRAWLEGRKDSKPVTLWLQWLVFFVIGVYAGFLQAGVGVFMLAGLVLAGGYNLVRSNAIKVALVATFTVPALAIFIYNDLVAWKPGLVYAAGSVFGGYLGSRLTVSWGPKFVRAVLICVVLVSSSKLLGLW